MTELSACELISSLNDQIHVWHCHPSEYTNQIETQSYYSLMSEEEKARYHRFRFERDKHNHLITRALIRTTLSRYEPKIRARDWQFTQNKYGKPKIANESVWTPEFNISHSNDLVVVALCKTGSIGVDIENIKARNNLEGLISHCFVDPEIKYISQACDEQSKRQRFFQLWTLKESYIKACGKGLSIGLKEMSFSLDQGKINVRFVGTKHCDNSHWMFASYLFSEEYHLSITYSPPVKKIQNFRSELV